MAAEKFNSVPDLLALSPIPDSGMKLYVALGHERARVLVLAFNSGHVMKEHSSPNPIILQPLDGELEITVAGETIALKPGSLLEIAASISHEVRALSDSRLQLTMLLG